MKPTPMTAERYLAIINDLIPKGWMPIGQFGSMTFRRNGKNYDLSAADLGQLDRIEREGLFLA
jgi:hypothetical protein